jgi:hypothetical protein
MSSPEELQKERMYSLETRACNVVKRSLEIAEWTVHAFDWFPVFSICRRYDLYEKNANLWNQSYELYRPSRPDFFAKSPSQLKCLVEVKGKSKHELIVDDYKYDSYIYWERFLGVPVFIVFYVSCESKKGETGLYLHKIQDVDIRFGEIRYNGKGFVNMEGEWGDSGTLWKIRWKEELAEELARQTRMWNVSRSSSRWEERKGYDLVTKPNVRLFMELP